MKRTLVKNILIFVFLITSEHGWCQNVLWDKFNSPEYDFVIVSDSQKNRVYYGAATISVFPKGGNSPFQKICLPGIYQTSKVSSPSTWIIDDFNNDGINDLAVAINADTAAHRMTYAIYVWEKASNSYRKDDTLSAFFSAYNNWGIDHERKTIRIYKTIAPGNRETEEYAYEGKHIKKIRTRKERTDTTGTYVYITEYTRKGEKWNKQERKVRSTDYEQEEL